jgi:tRNA threonylcarbamoyladenosine biosynthesis protein TsaE
LAETNALAASIADAVKPGAILALSGDLGAGKTAFSKAFAAALGIATEITSPTFTLMNIYPLPKEVRGIERFVHIDAYRLDTPAEFEALGAYDHIGAPGTVSIIEWAEKIPGIFDIRDVTRISISMGNSGERVFTIEQ